MDNTDRSNASGSEIAVIGMAGRFPGARNIDEFWRNLERGVESVSFFTEEELRASGISTALINNPNYVRARAVLEGADQFDATFFGFNHREAEILDPQQRIFLECAWEAVENAGYDCERYRGRVGVYAGASLNTYLLSLWSMPDLVESIGPFQLLIASDKDFLATRASYKLNLTGPSITVQTACSTSLVAVHLACQSLLNGECDMALAGGVSIRFPQKGGHLYQEGSFLSPDGHCRAFDANARGTVSGDGAGIVVLKRLEDALADGDTIRAIILGSAVNNDGAMKAGYTAPGADAQAAVIEEAQSMAGVDAETITYVEAHGTATPLGDPIEIAALTQAFRAATGSKGFCAIGSVKTNIGHLDAAAGIAGLIKVVKALEEKKLPPSLHFEKPNPKVDFANSPFYVNTALSEWPSPNSPRRAAVSSFGIGGTNAHVVLEQAPPTQRRQAARPCHLLVLSAKSGTALESATSSLARQLSERPDTDIEDVAYTLQLGRRAFEYRRMLVCSSASDASAALERVDPQRVLTSLHDSEDCPVAFMFSGQGSQYVNMGLGLYQTEPAFREQIDLCSELLKPHAGFDLRDLLYPQESDAAMAASKLQLTSITQPALFVVEYALAKLWMSLGVRPRAMIGHSIGEYVAACLAEVLTLEDALRLVAARGRLMESLPAGAMLAVPLPDGAVRDLLGQRLSLAAINSPTMCVVSGPFDAVDELEKRLAEKGVRSRRLRTSHAFHSEMMEPILKEFAEQVASVRLNAARIPYISNVTGARVTSEETISPDYWARHLRQTVLFSEGLQRLLKGFDGVLLEIGPGDTLGAFARQQPAIDSARGVLGSLRHPNAPDSDTAFLLGTLGKLWLAGAQVDWDGLYMASRPRRTPLPSYPFERQRYWIEPRREPQGDRQSEPTQKAALSKAMHPRPRLANEYVAPSNELEQSLASIWQELLGVEQLGVHDNFFNLGGHSLLATQLISQVRESFDVDLPLHRLFETPTVAGLAVAIEEMLIEKLESISDDEAERFLRADSQI